MMVGEAGTDTGGAVGPVCIATSDLRMGGLSREPMSARQDPASEGEEAKRGV